jgi:hypothetical protein
MTEETYTQPSELTTTATWKECVHEALELLSRPEWRFISVVYQMGINFETINFETRATVLISS